MEFEAVFYSYLGNFSVNFNSNTKIIERIVDRYNLHSFEVLIPIFTNLVSI